MAPKSMVAYI